MTDTIPLRRAAAGVPEDPRALGREALRRGDPPDPLGRLALEPVRLSATGPRGLTRSRAISATHPRSAGPVSGSSASSHPGPARSSATGPSPAPWRARVQWEDEHGPRPSVSRRSTREREGQGPRPPPAQKGLIPAVVYGRKPRADPPRGGSVARSMKAIETPHKFNTLLTLKLDGAEKHVLFKDYEVGSGLAPAPPRRLPRGEARRAGEVEVPVVTTGKAEGAAEGGILSRRRRTRSCVEALPAADPGADRGRRHEPQDRRVDPHRRAEGARGREVQVRDRLRRRVRRRAREGGGRRAGGRRSRVPLRPRARAPAAGARRRGGRGSGRRRGAGRRRRHRRGARATRGRSRSPA